MAAVRKVTPHDAKRCTELGEMMHAESKYAHIPFSRDKVMQLVSRGLYEKNRAGFVAEEADGEIIGFAAVYEGSYYFADMKMVQDLAVFVKPDSRSVSTVKALFKAIEDWAYERQAHSIVLGITAPADTDTTERLYKILGYERWGVVTRKEL